GLQRIAASAPPLAESPETQPQSASLEARIAVAQDRAFGFYYQDSMDVLREQGAEVVPFSPLDDDALPDRTDGVYLGGGFPELYATALSANRGMRDAMQRFAASGKPIYAECGGLMALGRALTTFEGETLPMFGLLPVTSRMQRERLTIGYREVEALRPSPLMPSGTRVRGHEFHWSVADSPAADLAAYRFVGGDGGLEGFCVGSILASYVHLNLAGAPAIAERFVVSSARARQKFGRGGSHGRGCYAWR
ncbi:MAG TPA: cobyrinate a,c-diamide synthase, partial [Chloroflexota bacterium]